MIDRLIGVYKEYFDDIYEHKHFKAVLLAAPKATGIAGTEMSIFSFIWGEYVNSEFPRGIFIKVAVISFIIIWVIAYRYVLQSKYPDPKMQRCSESGGTTYYYFYDRHDLTENSIVEIRKVIDGGSVSYALGCVNRRDTYAKSLMIINPIALYEDGMFIKQATYPVVNPKEDVYIVYAGALPKEVYEKIQQIAGGVKNGTD